MKKAFNDRFKKYTYELFAGDFYATRERDIVLTTLLGSCVSVCLRDAKAGVTGINHFMLPGKVRPEHIFYNKDGRYGCYAMEILINDMLKLGANKKVLEAKVFGGGKVLDTKMNNVAAANVDFTMAYLAMEGIPVLAADVGENSGRKVFLFPDTFSVFIKRIGMEKRLADTVSREKQFYDWLQSQRKLEGDLTLFNDKGESKKDGKQCDQDTGN